MKEMLEAEIWTIAQTDQGDAVLLRPLGTDITIPIFIGQLEMQSVLIGFKDIPIKRPLAHDLFLSLLKKTGLTLKQADVYDLKDDTFLARLIITGEKYPDDVPLVLDARPSDVFALAVRLKCPLMVSGTVVEKAGISTDLILEEMSSAVINEHPEKCRQEKHQDLFDELKEAIAAEEYEKAAEIRDTLNRLNCQTGKADI
jgi:bifunctional DNase/RNase